MSVVLHTVRLVVGIALIAGGVVLAQPFAAAVLAARQPSAAPVPGHGPMNRMPMNMERPATGPVAPQSPAEGGLAVPGQSGVEQFPGFPGAASAMAPAFHAGSGGFPPSRDGLDAASAAVMPPSRSPPPPPAPLPRSAADVSPSPPGLDGAYRSTLDIPPPPLLDTQSPPPLAVGWSANDVPRPAASPAGDAQQPATYVVRDGDDLTGIALRIYGSAGAAGAIWAANRDRLQDPQLLPIGMALRMPPSWTLPSAHAAQGGGHAIEPTFGTTATSAASWRTARPMSVDQHGAGDSIWLRPEDGEAGRQLAEPPRDTRSGPPTSIRVSPGDSLESIAVRFYGDRTAAARLWQANRDRLRSPDLLVPGTELRLP